MYSVNIRIEVQQTAYLARDPSITAYGAGTWNTGTLGLVSQSFLESGSRGALKDLVDEFLNDYLAANPKK